MEANRTINVSSLDATHRHAIEDVIGVPLQANQRLTIGVTEIAPKEAGTLQYRPPTIEDWTSLYDGLSDDQIEETDRIAKTRANLP